MNHAKPPYLMTDQSELSKIRIASARHPPYTMIGYQRSYRSLYIIMDLVCNVHRSTLNTHTVHYIHVLCIPGGPEITEQWGFQDFALINSSFFLPCWIEHLFLIIMTPKSLNLVENFLFYE